MATNVTGEDVRTDILWKQADTVRGYEQSRPAVPFEQVEFDIVGQVLRAHDVSPTTLLDLGAGDGLAAANMMDRMPVERAVLVDFSPPMLEAARIRFGDRDARIELVEGDLYRPDWSDALPPEVSYDLVISRHAIHHLPDDRKRALYREIFGLLRPGGMFVHIEHVKSRSDGYQRAFDQVMVESIHAHSAVGRSLDEIVRAYRTRMDGELNILADVWDQTRWLEAIGYTSVDVPFKALELAVFCGIRPAQEA